MKCILFLSASQRCSLFLFDKFPYSTCFLPSSVEAPFWWKPQFLQFLSLMSSFPACILNRFSHVGFFATQWTIAPWAPLSMEFSRQVYWNGLPCPPPGNLPNPGIEPACHVSSALASGFFTTNEHNLTFKSHFVRLREQTNGCLHKFKMDNQKGPTVQHMELCSTLCGSLDGRQFGREWMHVYILMSSFTVHLKLSHY